MIRLIIILILTLQWAEACKLWGTCTKTNITLPELSDDSFTDLDLQLREFFLQSNQMINGWALLGYGNNPGEQITPLHRSSEPATNDSLLYWQKVDTLLQMESGKIGIGHLRLASSGSESIPNPHPWMFHDNGLSYSLVHNGTISKVLLRNLITDDGFNTSWLDDHPPQTFGGGNWNGSGWANVVDSELLMLFIMRNINTHQSSVSGFKISMLELVNAGVNASQLNIIFSDGISLFIFGGQDGLYTKESTDCFSVMTQPPQEEIVSWDGIGYQEIIIIRDDGLIRYADYVENNLDRFETIIVPSFLQMSPAFPNPFNGELSFYLEGLVVGNINISIYSITGTLVDQFIVPGMNNEKIKVNWQPINELSSGTYFIKTKSNELEQSQKILFVK
ncbi:MAG: hypothetical protein CMG60_05630 [Candidatus Marinimicrobia bacterium]|nr:hypothetical protein [Candidatus Neomarinimicrobiota bacterium]|tara:strand:+ start:4844 stop:6016 length:1173 start_codon:yes stop_codon:yes gene_type:complete